MTASTHIAAILRDFAHGLLFGTAAGIALTVMGLCVGWVVWVVFPAIN